MRLIQSILINFIFVNSLIINVRFFVVFEEITLVYHDLSQNLAWNLARFLERRNTIRLQDFLTLNQDKKIVSLTLTINHKENRFYGVRVAVIDKSIDRALIKNK